MAPGECRLASLPLQRWLGAGTFSGHMAELRADGDPGLQVPVQVGQCASLTVRHNVDWIHFKVWAVVHKRRSAWLILDRQYV